MVEQKHGDLYEAVTLGADIVSRTSSLIVIGGLFYFVPSVAMLKLCMKPHEVASMGHIAYDVCKLSYLIGKGVIRKLIQVKNCILALSQKDADHTQDDEESKNSVAQKLEHSFHSVDIDQILSQIDLIEVEDGWLLVNRKINNGVAQDPNTIAEQSSIQLLEHKSLLATSQVLFLSIESLTESRIEVAQVTQSVYLCPISLQPIQDAVVSPSGTIYERQVILDHLKLGNSGRCPITREILTPELLQPLAQNLSQSQMSDLLSMQKELQKSINPEK